MAKSKKKKAEEKHKRAVIKIAGTNLSIWCPGTGEKWYIAYTPYYYDKSLTKHQFAPSWDDGHTCKYEDPIPFDENGSPITVLESGFDTAQDAFDYREKNIPLEEWNKPLFNPFEEDDKS